MGLYICMAGFSSVHMFEKTMEVLGIPNHGLRDGKDPKGSEPEQKEHNLTGLPGRGFTDQAHAAEMLSKLRAQLQNVSQFLQQRLACSCVHHACFAEAARAWWMSDIAMPLET